MEKSNQILPSLFDNNQSNGIAQPRILGRQTLSEQPIHND